MSIFRKYTKNDSATYLLQFFDSNLNVVSAYVGESGNYQFRENNHKDYIITGSGQTCIVQASKHLRKIIPDLDTLELKDMEKYNILRIEPVFLSKVEKQNPITRYVVEEILIFFLRKSPLVKCINVSGSYTLASVIHSINYHNEDIVRWGISKAFEVASIYSHIFDPYSQKVAPKDFLK